MYFVSLTAEISLNQHAARLPGNEVGKAESQLLFLKMLENWCDSREGRFA